MRPAISEVRVFDVGDEQHATVVGPIHLEDPESPFAERDVYLWTRVAPDSPHAQRSRGGEQTEEAAEAMGADEMDLDRSATAQAGSTAATPAMWSATVPVTEGRFEVGDRVFVEAWALVRTKNQQREFQVYWYDNDVAVVPGTAPVSTAK